MWGKKKSFGKSLLRYGCFRIGLGRLVGPWRILDNQWIRHDFCRPLPGLDQSYSPVHHLWRFFPRVRVVHCLCRDSSGLKLWYNILQSVQNLHGDTWKLIKSFISWFLILIFKYFRRKMVPQIEKNTIQCFQKKKKDQKNSFKPLNTN